MKRSWVPDDIQFDRPSAARMYDYYLGGYHNFEIDRSVAEQAIAIYPEFPQLMQVNRAFLRRVVRYLADQGVEQFLDIGSGIPTVGNVHEVAQQINPAARVVYVDMDPIAVAHSSLILQGNPNATIVQADVRRPEEILENPEVRRLLNFDKPVAVLLFMLLHFITDDEEASRITRVLSDALAPGSYLAISHAADELMPEFRGPLERLYTQTPTPVKLRSRAVIERFFHDLQLVEPGLVYVPAWWPEGQDDLFVDQPQRSNSYGGVARKR